MPFCHSGHVAGTTAPGRARPHPEGAKHTSLWASAVPTGDPGSLWCHLPAPTSPRTTASDHPTPGGSPSQCPQRPIEQVILGNLAAL